MTPKQERFCQEYLIDLNATAAAKRAEYKDSNIGRQLITKNNVRSRIDELMAARSLRTQVTQDRVLEELARIAFIPITQLASWDGESLEPVPSKELNADQAASIKKVKFKRTTIKMKDGGEIETFEVGVDQHDKLSALDKLAKHLNLYGEQDKPEDRSGLDSMIEALAEMRKRRG